jgi:hypothetical protein
MALIAAVSIRLSPRAAVVDGSAKVEVMKVKRVRRVVRSVCWRSASLLCRLDKRRVLCDDVWEAMDCRNLR